MAPVEQDLAFQRKQWRVQRFGWLIMTLLIVFALLGLFGSGLLSRADYVFENLTLSYNRFLRAGQSTEITLKLSDLSSPFSIFLENSYLENISLEQILPEPASVRVRQHGYTYTFNSDAATQLDLRIEYHPKRAGILSGHLEVDHVTYRLWHLVYP